ncbi:nucleotide kinase domain-containing protein [Nocardia sp. NPDC050175]|uniref:nucleotide kinase domain-containing protein n=1 Tax=Nocardia sp. NPDC050175 TaxID=3364317 RepID=UPI0037B6CCE9
MSPAPAEQLSIDGVGVHDPGDAESHRWSSTTIRAEGRSFATTPVFDTYWRFAARRHAVYEARLAGRPGPWTDDPILRAHRFTNCYRAADRVSQFLIRQVAYEGSQNIEDVVFRVLLFKMFNKISTWELLEQHLGTLSVDTFRIADYHQVLDEAFAAGRRLYSAAYVIPPPRLGGLRKHTNHLRLLQYMLDDGLADKIAQAPSLQRAFELLRGYPAMGDFLAFQFVIDLNYTTALGFDEMDFVVAGPGARDGVRKCFGSSSAGHERALIEYMAASQDEHFERLGLRFGGLFGRRLQLIDCQNLFCEVDKYARVAHPGIAGHSGRTRIKQKFEPVSAAMPAWFPPKWGLRPDAAVLPDPRSA